MPTPTLWLITAVTICLLMTGVLFSLYRSGVAGVEMCAWASAISTIGVSFNMAMPLNPLIPWLPISLVGSTLFGLGIVLTLVGVRQFFRLKVPWAVLSLVMVIFVVPLVLFWYVWPNWPVRTAIVSALRGVTSLVIAATVLRYRPKDRSAFPYLFMTVMVAGLGLMHTWRSGVYFFGVDAIQTLQEASRIQNIYFIIGLITLPGSLLGIVMMVHDRMLDQGGRRIRLGRRPLP